VTDQVSHPYTPTGRIMVLYILTFTFLDSRRDDKRQKIKPNCIIITLPSMHRLETVNRFISRKSIIFEERSKRAKWSFINTKTQIQGTTLDISLSIKKFSYTVIQELLTFHILF
jgi:hypothetical protein